MQLRESESHKTRDRTSRSGISARNTESYDNEVVEDWYRKLSVTEKCLWQPTQSNLQDIVGEVQRVKSVSEEDDFTLFPFD